MLAVEANQNVARFNIPVDDVEIVHVGQSLEDLG